MWPRQYLVMAALASAAAAAQPEDPAPDALPASAAAQLVESLHEANGQPEHVWRDTPPRHGDGTVNAYIEISRGDRRKWELDMRTHARVLDRIIPETVGGYPVNYGFVPQTVSCDGDPFDALVLGPPIEGGRTVRGLVVGLMYMEDEKGPDSKVVLSLPAPDGRPAHELTEDDRQRIAQYFRRYKEHDPDAHSSCRAGARSPKELRS